MIDVHTHIQFPAYDADRQSVIDRAVAAGVLKMIAVGTQAATSRVAIDLSVANPGSIWATVGFHPNHLDSAWYHDKKEIKDPLQEKFDIGILAELARHPRVVAIGECGLDYYRLSPNSDSDPNLRMRQKEVFQGQIQLALELKKPLMIHCRPTKGTDDAYEDLFGMLAQVTAIPRVIHFYVGSPRMTRRFLEAGFYFTFGGVVTFSRDYDEQISLIPMERILSETDAPYVAPLAQRGKRNEPAFILETVARLAEIKGVSVSEMERAIAENVRRVFAI